MKWVWLGLGGIVGWFLVELDRLVYFEQWGLKFRTSLAAAVWVAVAVFAVSSSGSRFASGLVLGVGLHLVYEFWRGRLVWPIRRPVSAIEQKLFGYGLTLVWVILAVWAI